MLLARDFVNSPVEHVYKSTRSSLREAKQVRVQLQRRQAIQGTGLPSAASASTCANGHYPV